MTKVIKCINRVLTIELLAELKKAVSSEYVRLIQYVGIRNIVRKLFLGICQNFVCYFLRHDEFLFQL